MLKMLGECIERQLENSGFAEARGEGEGEPMPCAHLCARVASFLLD